MPFSAASTLRSPQPHPPPAAGRRRACCCWPCFVLGGLAAPWLAPHNPAAIDLLHRLEGPSAAHWAGTDELGRDTLSRLLWGARLSLAVSVTVVAVSLALGLAIGGLAGYLGGWIDTALTTFAMNTFLALPGILLAIAFAAFLGPGFTNLVLALAIGGWAGYARLVRAQVMAVRDREYVDAARALGASGLRIFFRHILPNIVQPILVQAAIGMAGVILAEATLSFLGLGIPAPAPSWGAMLNDAGSHLFDSPHLVLFPPLPWPARCWASTSSATRCATSSTRARGWKWDYDNSMFSLLKGDCEHCGQLSLFIARRKLQRLLLRLLRHLRASWPPSPTTSSQLVNMPAYRPHQVIDEAWEEFLRPCNCGGHFRRNAAPRCMVCLSHSRRAPAAHIESGFIRQSHWRWQLNWTGNYCVDIEDPAHPGAERQSAIASSAAHPSPCCRYPHEGLAQPVLSRRMKIGVVSDTHGLLRPRFARAGRGRADPASGRRGQHLRCSRNWARSRR